MTTDRFQTLINQADQFDKAELTTVYNARIERLNSYKAGKATAKDVEESRELLESTIERLWSKYHGDTESTGRWFRDKQKAHQWYADQGGILTYSAFTRQEFTTEGRKVLRESVLELLLAERRKNTSGGMGGADRDELAARRERADTEKSESESRIAKVKAEDVERRHDKNWIESVIADKQFGAGVIRLFNDIAYENQKAAPEIALRLGLDVARREEIEIYIDEVVCRAFNQFASRAFVDMAFEEDDTIDDIDTEDN